MMRGVRSRAAGLARWLLFPGLNLHARRRYRVLPRFFLRANDGASRHVLDAGCGNGMLSYQAARRGASVVGISIKAAEVEKARRLFNGYLGMPASQIEFRHGNLYEGPFEPESFDEVICTEVLEHIRRDGEVCRTFWRALKGGGVLHICAPNAEHPYNRAFPLDPSESGGHVRPGYTEESYRALLEPIGFELAEFHGLGGPVRQAFNRRIKEVQERFGAAAGIPLFLLSLPFLWIDRALGKRMPFSIYVKAVKPLNEHPPQISLSRAGAWRHRAALRQSGADDAHVEARPKVLNQCSS
jgi:SAM-dependent methyltransferase